MFGYNDMYNGVQNMPINNVAQNWVDVPTTWQYQYNPSTLYFVGPTVGTLPEFGSPPTRVCTGSDTNAEEGQKKSSVSTINTAANIHIQK